jgi:hypothetical protein
MASALQSADFVQNNLVTVYDFDPDASTAVDVAWVDMLDYDELTVIAIRTIGTGAVDGFTILSNPTLTGGGTDVEVKTHATATEPDAIADFVVLSCRSDELGGNRYASANLELATDTDEFIVVYIRSKARYPRRALTADIIA